MKKSRWLIAAIFLLALVNVVFGIGSIIFSILNGVDTPTVLSDPGWQLALTMTTIGTLVALFRPGNPLGWIFDLIAFFQGLVSVARQYAVFTLITSPGALPGGLFVSWLASTAWMPGLSLLLTYAIMLYPTGRLPSPRWKALAWASALPVALFIPVASNIWPYRGLLLIQHPEQIPEPTGLIGVLVALVYPLMLACGIASLVTLVVRYRHGTAVERQQIKWVVFAATSFILAVIFIEYSAIGSYLEDHQLLFLITIPVVIGLPAAVGIAILRYRLWEIDLIINRTLVYIPLTGILAGLYSATISLSQRTFIAATGARSDGAVVLTTLFLVSMFTPIKNALQSAVDKRFKAAKDPMAPLTAFGQQVRTIEEVLDMEKAVSRLLREATLSLRASSGAVLISDNGTLQVFSKTPAWQDDQQVISLDIGRQGSRFGALQLGPRADGTPYTDLERSALASLAESLGGVFGLVYRL